MAHLSPVLCALGRLTFVGLLASFALAQGSLDPQSSRIRRSKDGWVGLTSPKALCFVDANGAERALGEVRIPEPPFAGSEPEAGAEPRFLAPEVQDLLGTPRGFAVALLQGVAWYGEGAPTHLATLRQPVLGTVGDGAVAAGSVLTTDKGDVLHVAEVGTDGAWGLKTTGLRGARALCVGKVGARWYVTVERLLTAREAAGGAEDPQQEPDEGPVKELWTSTDGAAWRRCSIPDAVRNNPVGMSAQCFEVGGAFVVSLGNTMLRATGPEAFEAIVRAGRHLDQEPRELFVAGDVLHDVMPRWLSSTRDLRAWTTRPAVAPLPNVRVHGVRDGKLVALVRDASTGRIVEWSEDRIFSAIAYGTPLPTPTSAARIELPGVMAMGVPMWEGVRLLIPTNLGIHESLDGLQWRLLPNSEWPRPVQFPQPRLESVVDGNRVMFWVRNAASVAASGLRVTDEGKGWSGWSNLLPKFDAERGAFAGATIAFLVQPKQTTYDGTGWTLRVSRDEGANWTETPSPVLQPQTLEHGPYGWLLSGILRKGNDLVDVAALSDDLAAWRMLELPNANNAKIRYAGDRLVALSTPDKPGIDAGAMVSVSEDGRSWITRTVKAARAGSLFTLGRQIWLQGPDQNWASLDGVNWHRMPTAALPMAVDAISRVDGTWFVRTVQENAQSAVRTEQLWCLPAVTDAQVEAAPRVEAPRFQVLTPEILWARAVAEADAAVSLAKTWQEREDAVRTLGLRWREAFPQATSDQGIQLAESWYARLLWYQFDESSVFGGFLAAASFLPEGNQEMTRRLMETVPQDFRDLLRDKAEAMTKGTPRKLRVTTPVCRKVEPQKQPALYDLQGMRESAAAGDPGAMYDLAICYSEGWGVPVDGGAAQHWMTFAEAHGFRKPTKDLASWRAAADAGSQYAMYYLGTQLANDQSPDYDPDAALKAFLSCADRGHIPSMTNAGALLLERAADESDFRRTFDYIQRAAVVGTNDGWTNLGALYEQGAGVERDLPKAIEYYRRAAEGKDPRAMRLLGELLVEGKGVAADRDAGLQMLEAAAQLGDAEARKLHATFRDKQFHVCYRPTKATYATLQPPEFDVAARRKLAQAGDAIACYDMMRAYQHGLGVRKHLGWSRYWAARVVALGQDPDAPYDDWCKRGSIVALGNVVNSDLRDARTEEAKRAVLARALRVNVAVTTDAAMDLLDGMPTPEQRREAVELLSWAAEQGCHRSLVRLGDLNLLPAQPKPAQALAYYERAAALGSVVAACKAAFLGVQQGMDPDRAMQLYLQASYMAPLPFDGTADTPEARAAHRLRECERILVAARLGRPEAVEVAAALLCRPPAGTLARNPEEALAMAWAARTLPWSGHECADTFADIRKDAGPETLHEVRGSALAHEFDQRVGRQLGMDDFAARVVASAPERSLACKAVQELLLGRLDGVLAKGAPPDQEILKLPSPGGLRAAAAKHPDLRGEALLHAMVGVTPGDRDAYRKALLQRTSDTNRGLLLLDLRTVEVVRLYYGIGCKADAVSAMSWHFMSSNAPGALWRGIDWMGKDFTPAHWQVVRTQLQAMRILAVRQ